MTPAIVSAELLRQHLDYHAWATGQLLDAADKLSGEERARDFHTADRSVLGTLVHIFAADRVWLARLEKAPIPQFVTDADRHFAVLQRDWPPLLQRWQQWAGKLTDEQANAPVSYTDLKGRSWTQPLWQPVLHVVNHGTHHRGQVSGFLRAMGHVPPTLDLIYSLRLKA